MGKLESMHILLCTLLCLTFSSHSLRCRSGNEPQPNDEFEYVVRVCVAQMRNNHSEFLVDRNHNVYNMDKNKNYQDSLLNSKRNNNGNNNNNNNNNRDTAYNHPDRGQTDGFDRWMSNMKPNGNNRDRDRDRDRSRQDRDRDRDRTRDRERDRDRNPIRPEDDYYEDSDYNPPNQSRFGSGNGSNSRRKMKPRPSQNPHSFQQQIQHDRDMLYEGNRYGERDRDSPYYYGSGNKPPKRPSNNEPKNESPLEKIDACVIHCIFQQMQMLDENGKPDKARISNKMTQRVTTSSLKGFIKDSVEDCFEMIEEEAEYTRYRSTPDSLCAWSKNFAMCLEDRGRQACDDWDDPINPTGLMNNQKNKGNSNKVYQG